MKAYIKREKVALILATIGLVISVSSLAIRLASSVPTPTPTPAATPKPICTGEPIYVGKKVFLTNHHNGQPIYLEVVLGSLENYAKLIGEFEDPKIPGLFTEFTPAMSVIKDGQATLEWHDIVKVIVRECISGLVYRYEILEKP